MDEVELTEQVKLEKTVKDHEKRIAELEARMQAKDKEEEEAARKLLATVG